MMIYRPDGFGTECRPNGFKERICTRNFWMVCRTDGFRRSFRPSGFGAACRTDGFRFSVQSNTVSYFAHFQCAQNDLAIC